MLMPDYCTTTILLQSNLILLEQRGQADVDVEREHPVPLLVLYVRPLLPHLRGHLLLGDDTCTACDCSICNGEAVLSTGEEVVTTSFGLCSVRVEHVFALSGNRC